MRGYAHTGPGSRLFRVWIQPEIDGPPPDGKKFEGGRDLTYDPLFRAHRFLSGRRRPQVDPELLRTAIIIELCTADSALEMADWLELRIADVAERYPNIWARNSLARIRRRYRDITNENLWTLGRKEDR